MIKQNHNDVQLTQSTGTGPAWQPGRTACVLKPEVSTARQRSTSHRGILSADSEPSEATCHWQVEDSNHLQASPVTRIREYLCQCSGWSGTREPDGLILVKKYLDDSDFGPLVRKLEMRGSL